MPGLEPIAERPPERLGELIGSATRTLAAAAIETPGIDARRLAAAATGMGAAELIARPEQVVGSDARYLLAEMLRRRCAGEPVSRILGEREFFGRAFAISPATLDPRPDSETLIEGALEFVEQKDWRARPLRVLDIGTGSGALLVTLLCELPLATGLGTDVSVQALAVAQANARRHGVAERASLERRDALVGVSGPFDLVVCNPPYIATAEIAQLAPEVRDFDPRAALDGGADGLDMYRRIIPALAHVISSGWIGFEVGAGQAHTVAGLLHHAVTGSRLRYRKDLGGHERCVTTEIQL
jgi:release factor glutamine methyltransferase